MWYVPASASSGTAKDEHTAEPPMAVCGGTAASTHARGANRSAGGARLPSAVLAVRRRVLAVLTGDDPPSVTTVLTRQSAALEPFTDALVRWMATGTSHAPRPVAGTARATGPSPPTPDRP